MRRWRRPRLEGGARSFKKCFFIYPFVVNDELSAFYLRRAVVGVPSAGRRRSPLRALHSSVLVVAHFLKIFSFKKVNVRKSVCSIDFTQKKTPPAPSVSLLFCQTP